ncbi:uncharacterized protein LOC134177196 isoform X1 [Corticium candelabrum]|uniref:uncharacterized protein LOC134177196 isoform X1 n=1 Tax=Corticium candelabrum TaxID=121492 RepID=UPI002E268129|nr:uncharacterized protein LOC134177196 isoform X1 [Corticium candelabrum]
MSDCRLLLITLASLAGVFFKHRTKADQVNGEACLVDSLFRMVAELNVTMQEIESEVTDLKRELENEKEKRINLEEKNVKLRKISDVFQTNNQSLIILTQQVQHANCQLQSHNQQLVYMQNVSLELQGNVAKLQESNCELQQTSDSLKAAVAHLGYNLSNITDEDCCSSTTGTMTYKEIKSCDYLVLGSSFLLPESTCRLIALKYNSFSHNGQYWIKPSCNNPSFQVFCDASEGWTLIMKIDGNRQTFKYNSDLWSNKKTFQPNNLDLDDKETKLASYWTLPFTELRLGMKVDGTTRWITFRYTASSLYSLIADGKYRSTSIGKTKWRSLLSRSSLQRNCNKEGFNAIRVRLGLTANQENDCQTPDSYIGFGFKGRKYSAGNYAHGRYHADHGGVNIKAIGYIMAR